MTILSRGEASPSPSSKLLVGPGKKRCVRGGLVGLNQEALCGEDPKGQPMIRREYREVVYAGALKGHPMIHRRNTRHRMPRPTEGKAEKKEAKSLGGPIKGVVWPKKHCFCFPCLSFSCFFRFEKFFVPQFSFSNSMAFWQFHSHYFSSSTVADHSRRRHFNANSLCFF